MAETIRNPHRCIYTSSYDRGGEHALKMWADVRKEVPDAELHFFYGWQLFVKFYHNNPSSMGWKAKMDEMLSQPGVFDHGRVTQGELIDEYKKSGIFVYPTHFGEISCISAMKAQCYGAIPVVINYAALETTVKYGIKVEGDIYDQETKEEYKKQLIALLKDNKRQQEIRKPMMEYANKNFGWNQVASRWTEEFHGN